MRELTMFCSARDQDVRVILTDDVPHDAQAPVHDAEVICLEIGEKCTGSLCPICAVSPAAMDLRLVKSGLRVLSSGCYITCGECNGTWRWSRPPENDH